jgi:hypothetical protein
MLYSFLKAASFMTWHISMHKLAVEFNPNNFDAWKVLYLITNSSAEEKGSSNGEYEAT